MTQSELLNYFERIARGGQRDANHEHYQCFTRFRQDTLDALHHFEINLQSLQGCERHLDPDMAGVVLATVNELQRREVAAGRALDEAGQNANCVAVTHSKLTKEREELKKELEKVKEEAAAAARRCAESAEQRQPEAVKEINQEAVSATLAVANRHMCAQEKERVRLESERQSLRALYEATLPEDEGKNVIRARDAAREQVIELTVELDKARGVNQELEDAKQQLFDKCQQLQAQGGTPADPHLAEWLRVAEQEMQGLNALLEERGSYVELQGTHIKELEESTERQRRRIEELKEKVKQPTTTTTTVVAMSPQQAMGDLAQFTQPIAQVGMTASQGPTPGPPTQ